MEQKTIVDGPEWPKSCADVEALHTQYIAEGETDEDAFTWTDSAAGRSYFFYGTKVMEFIPAQNPRQRDKFRVPRGLIPASPFVTLSPDTTDLRALLENLRALKRKIFRGIVTYTFGCCNRYIECSDARRCVIAADRFSNGCQYRENLEAGRIFYGRNRNV